MPKASGRGGCLTRLTQRALSENQRHRRQVDLAVYTSSENIVYSDLDHLLRRIEADPAELASVVTDATDANLHAQTIRRLLPAGSSH